MTIQDLRDQHLLLFECISGSKAYGLDLPGSDVDVRGVFILPMAQFYGLDYYPQVSDASQNEIFYELRRFVELLYKNNPNLLEMLNVPEDCVLYKHPLFGRIRTELFLSRHCRNTFAGYAMTQIRKARGLNKKILNPMEKTRKSVVDFCYVPEGRRSRPLLPWLEERGWRQEQCGLVNIPHMKDLYALFYDPEGNLGYQGMIRKPSANDVALSSVPKREKAVTQLYFNRDGYSSYCKDYKAYWDWVGKRNEERYRNTLAHGKRYDAKNMMHTFRLLDMAAEILEYGEIRVRRPNRDELLRIRAGEYEYEDLISRAEKKLELIDALYERSTLPEKPDKEAVEKVLVEVREEWYKAKRQSGKKATKERKS
jgi:hypothetical protein